MKSKVKIAMSVLLIITAIAMIMSFVTLTILINDDSIRSDEDDEYAGWDVLGLVLVIIFVLPVCMLWIIVGITFVVFVPLILASSLYRSLRKCVKILMIITIVYSVLLIPSIVLGAGFAVFSVPYTVCFVTAMLGMLGCLIGSIVCNSKLKDCFDEE